MKFLLVYGIFALLVISGLFFVHHSFGQIQGTPTSDFEITVQTGLQSLVINPVARSQQQEIQNEDYKSTWDEFGTNILIDGTTAPAEVDRRINQDVIQTVQTEANYDQQEAKYLEVSNVTPEEIQSIEESSGSDIPPGESIDPNPSTEANPDVSMSATEDQRQSNPSEGTSIENTSTLQTTSTSETNVSTTDVSTSSDETIFDAILQGEQTVENSSSEPALPPSESAPPPSEPPPAQ